MPERDPDSARVASEAPRATPLSLLERVRANDPQAWQRLLDMYQPLVRFWCARGGLGPEDVEDVSQEIFVAAGKGLPGFRRDRAGDTFSGWLRGITRNQLLLFHRRNQGKARAEGGSDAFVNLQQIPDPLPPVDEIESVEIGQLYKRALEQVRGQFDERHWQAFWLTVIEGRSPATLTVELGMTVANIRQAKSRILRRLKLEVGDLVE